MSDPDDMAIEAAIVARCETGKSHQGFLYGARHVIRDLRKLPDEQIVWFISEVRGDELGLGLDYERCHGEMMLELERIAMRAAIAAYEAALWQPIESAPKEGTVIDLWVPEWFLDSPQRVTDCSWRSARVPFSGRIAEGWFRPNDEFGSEDVWLPDDPDNQPGPTHWRYPPAPPKE